MTTKKTTTKTTKTITKGATTTKESAPTTTPVVTDVTPETSDFNPFGMYNNDGDESFLSSFEGDHFATILVGEPTKVVLDDSHLKLIGILKGVMLDFDTFAKSDMDVYDDMALMLKTAKRFAGLYKGSMYDNAKTLMRFIASDIIPVINKSLDDISDRGFIMVNNPAALDKIISDTSDNHCFDDDIEQIKTVLTSEETKSHLNDIVEMAVSLAPAFNVKEGK